jgi:segregation and condensation protein B
VLETLALIAYRQPITRAEIEDIRGVTGSSAIIKTLMDREWVRIVGHRDVPGKPGLYATTKYFLDYFNLKSLDELPTLADLMDLDAASDRLEEQLQLDLSVHLNQGLPAQNADLDPVDTQQDNETNDNISTDSTETPTESIIQDIEAFVEETIEDVMHDAEVVDVALESIEEALESVGDALEEITALEETTGLEEIPALEDVTEEKF